MNDEEVLTSQQAASLLGINEHTLKKLVEQKKIKTINGDTNWKFAKESLREFLGSNEKDVSQEVLHTVKRFLIQHADEIQKLATSHHKKFLGGKDFRTEYLEKYQEAHIKIVREFANNLQLKDLKRGTKVFKRLGEKLAADSIKDQITIEEAVDGIIFIKQALWQLVDKHGILDLLSTKDFFQVSHALGTYCDVVTSKIAFTYHKNYVKDLHEEKAKVEKLVKIRDNFISTASHELKTPITSLKTYIQGLRKLKKKEPESERYFDKIENQINKLINIIEDFLNTTKLQHGKLEFIMKEFDLDDLIKEAAETLQQTTDKHKIVMMGELKQKVFGDRDKIYQVITNFLTNAIKYSPQADKIIIRVEPKKDFAVVSVQDFGIGINKDQHVSILQQFYRVANKEGETFPGMGLGLFIANEIIKRHGSKITITSHKNKGSTFSFTLPYSSPVL